MEPVPKVLVTGFEPFGGNATNISQDVVHRLQGSRQLVNPWTSQTFPVHVETDVLTVDADGAKRTAARVENGQRWDAILHVGLCESCDVPRLERLAQDRLHMRIPDNEGRQINDGQLDGLGHRGCWLDLSLWQPQDFSVPFTLSTDAGAYLCNETYHATMKAVCERPSTDPVPEPVLFLHLPGETKFSVDQGVAMVESCLAYMLRPYPVAPQHVVAAALSSNGGEVLVGQRSAGEADGLQWEFPGGKCEQNESWSGALERELREELSLDVRAGHPLGSWYRQHGNEAFVIHLIHTTSGDGPSDLDLRVHQAVRWLSPNNVPELDWAGRDGEMMAFLGEVFKPTS
ncbi:MAG: NUDIX domain-containing protein [Candidatus Thermoplasmatota archaeon]|nr:NUDIX domain-containing protein [Candidatus Thermoplasmatota archaeon]MEC8681431.1 NUDIX domain-containing protein [Candidatus Thermoplasmatota archaeon]